MTATKAVAGGVAANVVTVILWAISNIPGWHSVPDEPKAAIIALVSACVGALLVYFAPANKRTLTENGAEETETGLRGWHPGSAGRSRYVPEPSQAIGFYSS
jgi:hypothetical protein